MHHNHEALKNAGDLGASLAAAVLGLSHWSAILSPIVSLMVGAATLTWWMLRFREWVKTGKVKS